MKATSRYLASILLAASFVTPAAATVQQQTSGTSVRRVARPRIATKTAPAKTGAKRLPRSSSSVYRPPSDGDGLRPPSKGDGRKPPKSDGGQRPPKGDDAPKGDDTGKPPYQDGDHHGDDRPRPREPRRPRWPVPGVVITIGGDKDKGKDDEKADKKKDKKKDEQDEVAKDPEPAAPEPAVDEVARPLKYRSPDYRSIADTMLKLKRYDAALRMLELLKEQEYFEYTGTFDAEAIADDDVAPEGNDLAAVRDLVPDYSGLVVRTGGKDKKKKKDAAAAEDEKANTDEKAGKDEKGKKAKKGKKDDEPAAAPAAPAAQSGTWEDRIEFCCDRLLSLEREADALRAVSQRTAAQEQRLAVVNAELARVAGNADRILDELSRQIGSKDPRIKRLRSTDRIVSALAQLPGTVALFTVAAEDRFWTIVISPAGRAAYSTPISGADFNRKVLDFRAVLYNPKQDPRPLARELYDIVLGSAKADPAFASATTLLWSFDGMLRYVPAAALHDGRGYLVERYRNVNFNRASGDTLAEAPSGRLDGVGLGVARKVGAFAALPAVADELGGIFVDAALSGDTGAVPGRVLLDTSFTEPALEGALRDGHSVVHIATHFQLSPKSARDSLLLLGDGSLVDVGDIRKIQGGFRGVELLTLSACNTAASAGSSDGKEVECFGTIAQERGAKAVIASLWPVSDRSTSALMQTFYQLRAANPGVAKAELLRRAQASLLAGRLAVPAGTAADRALVHEEGAPVAGQPTFTPDPKAPFAHPYYWAPFVMIGNCR